MSLQFVDMNADGFDDIVTATFEGTVFVVLGSAEGWSSPQHIKDQLGRNVVLSLYYDTKLNSYQNADRSPVGQTNAQDHCVSAMLTDWDQDGDLDLLLGAKQGRLYLQKNLGSKELAKFSGKNELLAAGGEEFRVPGGLTAARLIDWDHDGLDDLICGSFGGRAYFYRNTGKLGAPTYAAPETLASARPGVGPQTDWYLDVVDFDGDGDLDLVVGGHFETKPNAKVLSPKEEKLLSELHEKSREIGKAFEEFMARFEDESKDLSESERTKAHEKLMDDPAYTALTRRFSKNMAEVEKLSPRGKRESGIWLFRKKGKASDKAF